VKVISVNIANPVTFERKGRLVQTGLYKKPVESPVLLDTDGVAGDTVSDRRHHGGPDKACYLFGANHYAYWQALYPHLEWSPGMFGENLTVSVFEESSFRIGDVLQVGEAIVRISQPRQPCYKLAHRFGDPEMVRRFLASGHSGAYLRVLQPGYVRTSDAIYLLAREAGGMRLDEVFALFDPGRRDVAALRRALALPTLAQAARKDLEKLLRVSGS